MLKNFLVYVLSDSVGDTAEQVARASAEQYEGSDYEIKKYPYVESKNKIDDIMEDVNSKNSIFVYTIVNKEISEYLRQKCEAKGVPYIDVMAPCLNTFTQFLEKEPARESGVIRKLDEDYFKRVEAVEFAVKYDDGKDPRGILKADIVLIGVSRSSKTPLSMYFAYKNYRVANLPLVPEVEPPKELYEIDNKKIIGLTNDPRMLNAIRRERLKDMGIKNNSNYANLNRIIEELDYADKIFNRLKCPIINVSTRAIEETANIIIQILSKNN